MKAEYRSISPSPGSSFTTTLFEGKEFIASWHFHPQYELTYILGSTGIRYVGDNMGNFEYGDLVLVGSNLPHCWKTIGEQKEEVCFLEFTIFGRMGEIANQYLHKGSKVLLEGRLIFEQWTAQDGTARSRHSLKVEAMKMLDSKPSSEQQGYQAENNTIKQNPPVVYENVSIPEIDIDEDPEKVSKYFNKVNGGKSPFSNSGVYFDGVAYSLKTQAAPKKIVFQTLGDVLQKDSEINPSFYVGLS